MICLIKDDTIIHGPAPWDYRAILEHLIVAGFDVLDGYLVQAEAGGGYRRLCDFSGSEPASQMLLPGGIRICPAVQIEEPAPEGMMQSGREPVILEDRVELRPMWMDVPPPPPGLTLAQAKAVKQTEIKAKADAILLPLVIEYPECEVRTWEQQATEATALQADPNAAAPLVRGMAQERGVDVLYLAGRILFHAAEWKAVSGPVIGQRQKFQDQLDAITADTPENATAVLAIVVNYNLPL